MYGKHHIRAGILLGIGIITSAIGYQPSSGNLSRYLRNQPAEPCLADPNCVAVKFLEEYKQDIVRSSKMHKVPVEMTAGVHKTGTLCQSRICSGLSGLNGT